MRSFRVKTEKKHMVEKDADILFLDEIEEIEKITLRWIFQAVFDLAWKRTRYS